MHNGVTRVFRPKQHNRECPSRIVLMVTTVDSKKLEMPILILRSCTEQTEKSSEFDSIFLTRFAKKYNVDGSPHFTKLEINKALDRVMVIEDFHELFESQEDRRQLIMEGPSLPVNWYEGAYKYNIKVSNIDTNILEHHSKKKKINYQKMEDSEMLNEDWAYVILPYDKWHLLFSDCIEVDNN